MKNKNFIISIVCFIAFICIFGLYQMFYNKKPVITYHGENETIILEAGESFDYLKDIEAKDCKGNDITKNITYKKMNENELGEHNIVYTVEDERGNSSQFTLKVNIVDTKAPTILAKDTITLEYGSDFTLDIKNSGVQAIDSFEGDITSKIKIDGSIDTKKAGKYLVTFTVEDSSGNVSKMNMTIIVKEKVTINQGYSGPEYYDGILNPFSITPKIVSNPSSMQVVVNKYNALPDNYAPNDLVKITSNGGNILLRKEAAQHWEAMQAQAKSEGIILVAFSGYRTKDYQKTLFYNYYNQSPRKAYFYSAVPRRSEHELGLALDIGYNQSFPENFYETPQGKWLQKNAHLYGFVLRYPSDKVNITQYAYESWHYRYVGVEDATKMKISNLTLEEYYHVS